VGALAHYLEEKGVPTSQISLIREHTEAIRPPRALWVPFELGRPLGRPLDTALQRRVVLAALGLFKAAQGPLIADFTDEGASSNENEDLEPVVWACPVNFTPADKDEGDPEKLISALRYEVAELRSWYDLGLEKSGRTAVSNFEPDSASGLLAGYVLGDPPDIADVNLPLALALRLAAQDLKAFYFEATIARPGAALPGSNEFNRWFWNDTAAARILKAVKEKCLNEKDEALRMTGAHLLIPLEQS
jgi:hypothetical protein